MPIQYPERLLPEARFQVIRHDPRTIDGYLIRHTEHTDIQDPATGHLLPSCVAPQTDHLHDLSTSLLGIFMPADVEYQLTGGQKSYFTGLWTPGEIVPPPVFEQDFVRRPERGFFVLRAADISGQVVPYNVGAQDNLTAVCQLIHTPVRANFWHFSIRWFNTEGDVLLQNGNWKRRLLTACKALICQFARLEIPNLTPPPTEWYDPAHNTAS